MDAELPAPEVRTVRGRVVIDVHVQPGASRDRIVGRHGQACKVAVTAPPADGRANEAVCRVLAEVLSVPRRSVVIVSGHGSRRKTVAIEDLDAGSVEVRLTTAYGRA